MSTQPVTRLTVEEYLKIERVAEFRSEYIEGEMVAMAGGSPNHAFLAAATVASLHGQLAGGACSVAASDLRIACDNATLLTYPDIVVCCRPLKFHDREKDTIVDATAIIEVLSRSTQNYDRGEKFRSYRTMPSFSEYILLDQYSVRAEHHVRQSDGSWVFREIRGPAAIVEIGSIGCRLELDLVYRGLELESGSGRRD